MPYSWRCVLFSQYCVFLIYSLLFHFQCFILFSLSLSEPLAEKRRSEQRRKKTNSRFSIAYFLFPAAINFPSIKIRRDQFIPELYQFVSFCFCFLKPPCDGMHAFTPFFFINLFHALTPPQQLLPTYSQKNKDNKVIVVYDNDGRSRLGIDTASALIEKLFKNTVLLYSGLQGFGQKFPFKLIGDMPERPDTAFSTTSRVSTARSTKNGTRKPPTSRYMSRPNTSSVKH